MSAQPAPEHAPDRTAKVPLREGFSTGTAATAAALAAASLLLGPSGAAWPPNNTVRAPLPPFEADGAPAAWLDVPVARCERLDTRSVRAEVIKDGGDDPDATHGMVITATVCLFEATRPSEIVITAGVGIGRATLPGLPPPVGAAAINPVPRQQIRAALTALALARGYTGALSVCLDAPEGEARARHTLNARLGIVGGISILGTSGLVKPYSHEAWQEVIRQGTALAAAQGCEGLGLSTGRRTERLLMAAYPDWPEQAFVQMADFAAMSVRAAVQAGFKRLAVGLFIGKLLKIAQGLEYTHAHSADLDLAAAAAWARAAGHDDVAAEDLRNCNTAMQALEIILRSPAREAVLAALTRRAAIALKGWSVPDTAGEVEVEVRLFDFTGHQLYIIKL